MIRVATPCLGASLEAGACFVGPDLWVFVAGGDAPHIGSVSVGIPRESLTGDGSPGATVSTFNVTGHKDDIVGNLFAQRLTTAFSCKTSITCGIHFDNAASSDLTLILAAADELLEKLTEAVRRLPTA